MRLLHLQDNGEFSLTEFYAKNIPQYAILSHTWGSDHDEVTFKDIKEGTGKNKEGYKKLSFCAKQAARNHLRYFWVDTCCIDKSNNDSREVQEAINSMFRWYKGSKICYVYLYDVSVSSTAGTVNSSEKWIQFEKCKWFTRGWTVQELIAPESVEFFSKEVQRLGDKTSLSQMIQKITSIPERALQGCPLSFFSESAERLCYNLSTKKGTKFWKGIVALHLFCLILLCIDFYQMSDGWALGRCGCHITRAAHVIIMLTLKQLY